MKKTSLTLALITAFVLSGCFSGDDYNDRYVRLTIADAFTFKEKKDFVVGDTLVFELKFSRYLEEEGYTNLLDIYETSTSNEFGYSFGVSKFSDFSNNFERINIDEGFILGTRSDNYGYYGYTYLGPTMAALLTTDQQEYTSKVGIVLVEAGRFRIDLENLFLSSGYDYDGKRVVVEIEHHQTVENQSEAEFVVTEN